MAIKVDTMQAGHSSLDVADESKEGNSIISLLSCKEVKTTIEGTAQHIQGKLGLVLWMVPMRTAKRFLREFETPLFRAGLEEHVDVIFQILWELLRDTPIHEAQFVSSKVHKERVCAGRKIEEAAWSGILDLVAMTVGMMKTLGWAERKVARKVLDKYSNRVVKDHSASEAGAVAKELWKERYSMLGIDEEAWKRDC